MPPANPFVRAAAEAEAARFALAAADDFARFFAGDLAELQMRWMMERARRLEEACESRAFRTTRCPSKDEKYICRH